MTITELLDERISTRAFLDKKVPLELITDILTESGKSPSGGNLQPWKVYVVEGASKEALVASVKAKIDAGLTEDNPDIAVYPEAISSPYRERRYACGMALYEALGINKADKKKRQAQWIANYEFFGAPVGMIFTMNEEMGPAQYLDLGMFLQTVMLVAQAKGLSTCPQLAWAAWAGTTRQSLKIGSEETVICGMSLGYGDKEHPVNQYRTQRCSLEEFVTVCGFEQ